MSHIKKFSELNESVSHVGQELIDLLKEFDLGIHKVEKGDFLSGDWELPNEKGLTEYRLTLGTIWTKDKVKDNWNEIPSSLDGEYDDYLEDVKKIGQTEVHNNYEMTFSVFLPEQKIDDIKCLVKGLEYLNMLSQSATEVYDSPPLDGRSVYALDEDIKFKKFMKFNNINITNDNFKIIGDYSYRLYYDSKFFFELEDYCKDNDFYYKELISNVLNIL